MQLVAVLGWCIEHLAPSWVGRLAVGLVRIPQVVHRFGVHKPSVLRSISRWANRREAHYEQ
jgi:hypothetical protein